MRKIFCSSFNDFFGNTAPNLGIDVYNLRKVTTSDTNSLTSIIEKYKHYPSIKAIKNYVDKIKKSYFSSKEVKKPFLVTEMKNLNPQKT